MPTSKITNPFLASHITSLVRGVVSELLNALPKEVEVCNVTTAGFLCTVHKNKVDSITKGPLSKYFGQCAKSVTGKASVLEIKHSVKQVLGWRTRGQLTIESDGEKPMVLARGGIKPPTTERTESKIPKINAWFLLIFPVGIGLKQVLVINASRSASYHIFRHPAAPAPIATKIILNVASIKLISCPEVKKPTAHVNITRDITLGFISNRKAFR